MDPRQKLALALLGQGSLAVPPKQPMTLPPFEQPGTLSGSMMPMRQQQPAFPPFTGLRNEPGTLPGFQSPGDSLAIENYMNKQPNQGYAQPPTMPPVTVSAQAPQMPAQQPWQALGDQSRTAAFDPVRDANDPGNVNMVDAQGMVNPQQGPYGPGQQQPGTLADITALIQRMVQQGQLGPQYK